ncbi:MAG: response regulator transcription factor [Pseudomonadota bacterium]
MSGKPIRLYIVEDQAMILGALAALLEREPDLDVVGTATSAEEALKGIPDECVDVVLSDIELPGKTGIELAEQLRSLAVSCRIVMLTTFARAGYFERAMAAGAAGYILKDSPAGELASAIRRIAAGERVIDPELVAAAWATPNPLSQREQQCLRLAGDGLPNSEIAASVFLSEGTVRNYLSSALQKLEAGNRTEAARLARQKGWI